MTNGVATFSVQKPAVQKHVALEYEVNNFSTICKFRVCNGGNPHYDRAPLHDIVRRFRFYASSK